MVTGVEIYVDQIQELGGVIKEAIQNHDIVVLKGIQALESTIWNKVRGSESILCTIIGKACDELDLKNPEKDRASKIKTKINDVIREDWQGIPLDIVEATLHELEDLGLIKIHTARGSDSYGNEQEYINAVSLTPVWNPIIENRTFGNDHTIFASSIGKFIGLSIAGREPDRLGRYTWGVGSWRPVSRTMQKLGPDGKISKEEMMEIFIETTRHGKRKFYDVRERDRAKAEEIRFIVDDSGKFITINRDAIRAYEIIRERGLRRSLERERGR